MRSRPSLTRVIGAVLVVGFGAMGFAGGLLATPSAEPAVQEFLLAWQQGQYQAAAALTTGNPSVVADQLRGAYRQLDAAAYYLNMGPISQHGDTAEAAFQASVDLGQDGAPWEYQGRFALRWNGADWKVVWAPSVVNPHLRPGLRLAVLSTAPARQWLLDAAGKPLQAPETVYVAGVRPDHLRNPGATARALSRITGIDPHQLLGWILAAPSSHRLDLVVFRPGQYVRHRAALNRVPDLIVWPETRRLFASIAPAVVGDVGTEDSAALRNQGIAYLPGATIGLSGLQRAYQRVLAGTPTTKVVTETADGRQITVLKQWTGTPAKSVQTTIGSRWQQAANSAVSSLPFSSAIVAVQASTGHILAVAEHREPGGPPARALAGHYPPGTAFTIVSAAALLTNGLAVNTALPCPSVNDVDGTTFRNEPPEPNLGQKPSFAADFAHACATAFIGPSLGLPAAHLGDIAAQFGLGSRYQLCATSACDGMPAFSGSMQASATVADLAADMIGRGSVQVSPLAMAMVAAQVDTGIRRAPTLVTGTSVAQAPGPAVSRATLSALRSLMRKAAKSNGANAADLPRQPVGGQSGVASMALPRHQIWSSWFVGYRGDVAFAVLVLSSTSPAQGSYAVPMSTTFLNAAPRR